MTEPMFNVNDAFVVVVAEVYRTTGNASSGRKAEEYVYRMKGAIPLMREGQLKLLERITDENHT